jgi:hypothetical protein
MARVYISDTTQQSYLFEEEKPIKLHVLICFMALTISKHIEIKSSMSIRAFINKCKIITDGKLFNKINKKEIIM